MRMIFEDVAGGPVARREHDASGDPRVVDGVRFFDLAGAAEHFIWTEQQLREHYVETFAEAAVEQIAKAQTDAAAQGPAPLERGPLTAAADPILRHFVYGHLEDAEFECFLRLAEECGFNPWTREVIPEVEVDADGRRKVHQITTIGYLRKVAQRHDDYDGQLGPFWCAEDGEWKDVWTAKGRPHACKVGIKRHGSETISWGVIHWQELGFDGEGLPGYYETMPAYMIAIRAEATALRKAYANASRLYLREEMPRAGRGEAQRPAARTSSPAAVARGESCETPAPRYREEQRDDGRRVVYDGEPEYYVIEPPRVRRRIGVG